LILYLTINDQPSGVYWSQVTDVVNMLDRDARHDVRLLALVSLREYSKIKKQIKAHCPKAIVLPMYPKMQNWKKNGPIVRSVCRSKKVQAIIARGAFATSVAINARDKGACKKVCFDARGAYAAEWNEYRIIDDNALIASVEGVERKAILQADFRLSVSEVLVKHWRDHYRYSGTEHVVIPCTLGADHSDLPVNNSIRDKMGVAGDETLLVYSGSTAGWQSFELLRKMSSKALKEDPKLKVLFLSKEDENNEALKSDFPDQVIVKWLKPSEVSGHLNVCDVGILIREDSVTNQVSSPTKFAEYLNAGLNVLISKRIGDMSAFVEEHGCGKVIEEDMGHFVPPIAEERERNRALARTYFTKEAFAREYAKIMEVVSN